MIEFFNQNVFIGNIITLILSILINLIIIRIFKEENKNERN